MMKWDFCFAAFDFPLLKSLFKDCVQSNTGIVFGKFNKIKILMEII